MSSSEIGTWTATTQYPIRVADEAQLVLAQNMGHMFVQVGPQPINPGLPQIAQDIVVFFDQYRTGG